MNSTLSNALEIVLRTDPGMVRGHNEDAVFANPNQGFVILADGMGGYNAGEVASGMATMLLSTELETAFAAKPPHEIDRASGLSLARRYILDKMAMTNSAIYKTAESQPQYAGMGTTLVVAVFRDNRLLLGHVPARSRTSLALVFGPVATGAWGALVASAAALVDQPEYFALSIPCGAIAGALQGVWWVPLSVWLERRDLPRWPVALLSALPAPALGFAGVFGVVFVIDAVV